MPNQEDDLAGLSDTHGAEQVLGLATGHVTRVWVPKKSRLRPGPELNPLAPILGRLDSYRCPWLRRSESMASETII